jgi:hypothetical protein
MSRRIWSLEVIRNLAVPVGAPATKTRRHRMRPLTVCLTTPWIHLRKPRRISVVTTTLAASTRLPEGSTTDKHSMPIPHESHDHDPPAHPTPPTALTPEHQHCFRSSPPPSDTAGVLRTFLLFFFFLFPSSPSGEFPPFTREFTSRRGAGGNFPGMGTCVYIELEMPLRTAQRVVAY